MLFSQRKGLKEAQKLAQVDSMDNDLRNGLWSALYECILRECGNDVHYWCHERLLKSLWFIYLKWPTDTLPDTIYQMQIREYFMECQWFEVYDILEFICKNCHADSQEPLRRFCNEVLDRENSAYRFVDDELVEISSPAEIDSIEDAISASSNLAGVQTHLKTALSLIADRKNPDYRNSIKESISAVESLSKTMSGDSNATLGSALKVIESAGAMHPALKKGLSSLYGYTSDADGIRHAMLEESQITFADAKFMFVACTAFVNYMLAKASELGLSLKKEAAEGS